MGHEYQIPAGMHAISPELLDLRPDSDVDHDLLHPRPVTDEKNVWFYWNTGFTSMHPYSQRNVRIWHRRLSRLGWVVRILDVQPGSPLNVANFLDVTDPALFPQAFIDGTLTGPHAVQHKSDLVRFPLLLKYGGVYADVGMLQIGDFDRLWRETVGNPDSPYDVFSYSMGNPTVSIANYMMCTKKDNPLFLRSHKLLLALWGEDGGKTSTDDMRKSALIKEVPQLPYSGSFTEDGRTYGPEEVSNMLADYIIQGQACEYSPLTSPISPRPVLTSGGSDVGYADCRPRGWVGRTKVFGGARVCDGLHGSPAVQRVHQLERDAGI